MKPKAETAEQIEVGKTLHRLLLNGDSLAPSKIAELYFPLLEAYLERGYYKVDNELRWDAITQAYFSYIENPNLYNPEKLGLLAYLKMAAEQDLRNALAKQSRRTRNLTSLDNVAVVVSDGNINIEEQIIQRERLDELRKARLRDQQIVADKGVDQQLLELIQSGVRATAEFAKVLNIEHLPVEEQRREVKRHKDRLRVYLKRNT